MLYCQVIFTGGRTQPGTTKPDEGERHPYSILDCEPKREAILPSVIYIQKILRRRPFLIKYLENVMRRFLQSLEFFEENERKKLAIFTALAFSQKLSGLPPETVFQPLLKDNLVAKGLVLSFITDFFKEYLMDNSLDDLISILKRGKVEDNLLEFFPSAKRSAEGFSEHFTLVYFLLRVFCWRVCFIFLFIELLFSYHFFLQTWYSSGNLSCKYYDFIVFLNIRIISLFLCRHDLIFQEGRAGALGRIQRKENVWCEAKWNEIRFNNPDSRGNWHCWSHRKCETSNERCQFTRYWGCSNFVGCHNGCCSVVWKEPTTEC